MRWGALLLVFGIARADVSIKKPATREVPTLREWRLRWPEHLPCKSFPAIEMWGTASEVHWGGDSGEIVLQPKDGVSIELVPGMWVGLRYATPSAFRPGFDKLKRVGLDHEALALSCGEGKESLTWNLAADHPVVSPYLTLYTKRPFLPPVAKVVASGTTRKSVQAFLKSAQNLIERVCTDGACPPEMLRAASHAGQLANGQLQLVEQPGSNAADRSERNYAITAGSEQIDLMCRLDHSTDGARMDSCDFWFRDAWFSGDERFSVGWYDDDNNRTSYWQFGKSGKIEVLDNLDGDVQVHVDGVPLKP